MEYRLSFVLEYARIGESVVQLHRGVVETRFASFTAWKKLDQTNLFDNFADAEHDGKVLLALYAE